MFELLLAALTRRPCRGVERPSARPESLPPPGRWSSTPPPAQASSTLMMEARSPLAGYTMSRMEVAEGCAGAGALSSAAPGRTGSHPLRLAGLEGAEQPAIPGSRGVDSAAGLPADCDAK